MNKRALQILCIVAVSLFILSLYSVAMAGTLGDTTSSLKQGSFEVGAEIDFTRRDVKEKSASPDKYELKSARYLIKGDYGVTDFLDIYLKLGVADSEFDILFDANNPKYKFDGDSEFAYGAGVNWTFYQKDSLKFGFGFQVMHFKGESKIFEMSQTDANSSMRLDGDLEWWEYDVVLGTSYDVQEALKLYGGVLYSIIDGDVEWKFRENIMGNASTEMAKFDVEEDDSFGIVLGGKYNFTPRFNMGFETRLINETSFSLLFNLLLL